MLPFEAIHEGVEVVVKIMHGISVKNKIQNRSPHLINAPRYHHLGTQALELTSRLRSCEICIYVCEWEGEGDRDRYTRKGGLQSVLYHVLCKEWVRVIGCQYCVGITTVSKHTFTSLLRSCKVRGGRGKIYRKSMVSTIASTTGTSLRPVALQ